MALQFTVVLIVLAYIIYRFMVFPVFLSPLAKIPTAHWSCSISPLWILWKRLAGQQNVTVLAAHRKHGDVVRLGPTELSVNCVEDGYKTIYAGNFGKDDYYRFFDNFGTKCMFTTSDRDQHAVMKRFIARLYSKTNVQQSPVISAQLRTILYDRFVPILDKAAIDSPPEGIDIYSLYQAVGFDIISALYLGLQCSPSFLEDIEMRERWRRPAMARARYSTWLHELPNLINALQRLGLHVVPRAIEENLEESGELGKHWYRQTVAYIDEHRSRYSNPGDEPLLLAAIVEGWRKEQKSKSSALDPQKLADPEFAILSELADNLFAGYETTSLTMLYLSWRLAKHSGVQDKLRKELRKLDAFHYPSSNQSLPDAKALDALPLLDAVISETLRLYGAVPGGQPRIVPKGGCRLGRFNNIPEGTRVAASAYVLHRNPEVFPQPEEWDPLRWLNGDPEKSKAREQWSWAFSSGQRVCTGKYFALHVLKMLTAAIFTNYSVYVVNDYGIEQEDGHTKGPKADAIYLGFACAD